MPQLSIDVHAHHPWPAVVILPAWLGICFWLRAIFISADAPQVCIHDARDFGCATRALIGMWIHLQHFGTFALLLALLAWLPLPRVRRATAVAAIVAACWALVFYNVNRGSVAAVLALLAFQRADASTRTRD